MAVKQYLSPIIQYRSVDPAKIIGGQFDLLITDADPLRAGNTSAAVTGDQLAMLQQSNVDVLGYVDIAVTDDSRPYWQSGVGTWTSDGTDTGTPTADAPAWLNNSVLIDFDKASQGPDARIVDFSDPAWQALIIEQVLDIQARGFNGVFLDDAGAYVPESPVGATIQERAAVLVDLVSAIRASTGPDFTIVINGNPYLGVDAGKNAQLLDAIDAMVLESYARESVSNRDTFIDVAKANIEAGAQLLAIDYLAPTGDTLSRAQLFDQQVAMDRAGIASFVSNAVISTLGTQTYDNVGIDQGSPTALDDVLFGAGVDDKINGGDGADQIAGLAGADMLLGGAGHDTIVGGAGEDGLNGGAGDDILIGGLGADRLLGGKGADTFVYNSTQESTVDVGGRDVIQSFNHNEGDRIDLSAIDANISLAGDQVFQFIGSNDFSGTAGQLRWEIARSFNGNGQISGDVNGDGLADFIIQLNGRIAPSADDFIL